MCMEYSLNWSDECILKHQHQKFKILPKYQATLPTLCTLPPLNFISTGYIFFLSTKTSLCSRVHCDNVAPRCFPLKALWLHETMYLPSNALAPLDARACTHHIPSDHTRKAPSICFDGAQLPTCQPAKHDASYPARSRNGGRWVSKQGALLMMRPMR